MGISFKAYIGVIISFVIAMILAVFPISESLMWVKPNFIVLILIYWVVKAPKVVGIYFAFVLGILLDLLLYRTLGVSSIALCIVVYLSNLLRNKLNSFCLWQQALTILILVGFYQLILVWSYLFEGNIEIKVSFWLTLLINIVFWPIIYFVMSIYHRFLNINM